MELFIIFILLANTTLMIMAFRQIRKAISCSKVNNQSKTHQLKAHKKDATRERDEEARKRQMKNFFSYTGDKQ